MHRPDLIRSTLSYARQKSSSVSRLKAKRSLRPHQPLSSLPSLSYYQFISIILYQYIIYYIIYIYSILCRTYCTDTILHTRMSASGKKGHSDSLGTIETDSKLSFLIEVE